MNGAFFKCLAQCLAHGEGSIILAMSVLKLLTCNLPKPMKRGGGEKSMCLLSKVFLKKQRKENSCRSKKRSWSVMKMSPPLSSLVVFLLPPFLAMRKGHTSLTRAVRPVAIWTPHTYLSSSRSALPPQALGMCVKMRVVLQMRALQNDSGPGAQTPKPAIQPGDHHPPLPQTQAGAASGQG